ncbi:peroxisomal biogenesis factor 11 [Cystobasidium minutum MCA 4210]|uniref:peroxisomal biogenesis factor 11 n=1 Tax=Cystobasidium minutum MCA 4210 TaxID=1397322 RepID=UPI0034CFAE50|eukprot:jgi/Rhomi1/168698/fgenesh1_kg.3_\
MASQIILHPYVNDSLKVAATTVGRDKVYRSVQYAARFLAWYYAKSGYSKEAISQMSAIKSALATTRKVMRLGKPIEHLQAALKAQSIADPILKFTAIIRQLGYAAYLANDHLVWAHSAKIKIFAKDKAARIGRNANRAWAIGIAASIVSGLYKLQSIQARSKAALTPKNTPEKESDRKIELKTLMKQYKDTRFQLIQDLFDFTLPMTNLGYFGFNEGVLGLAGLASSLMGLSTQANKVLGSGGKVLSGNNQN